MFDNIYLWAIDNERGICSISIPKPAEARYILYNTKHLVIGSKHFTPGAKKFELNLIRTCRRGNEIFFVSKSSASRPNIGPVVVHSFRVSGRHFFFLTPKNAFLLWLWRISCPTTSQERFLFTNIWGFFIGMVELGSVLRRENHLKEFQNLYFNFCHTPV